MASAAPPEPSGRGWHDGGTRRLTQEQPVLHRLREATLLRYLVASAISLGVDLGGFTLLLALGALASAAAAAGYGAGILAHWLISSRTVFTEGVASRGRARTRQKGMFVLSALVGLGLTTLIVGGATMLGTEPYLAKLAAMAISFTATWLLRSRMVFTEGLPR